MSIRAQERHSNCQLKADYARSLLYLCCFILAFLKSFTAFATAQGPCPIYLSDAVQPYQFNEDDRWEGKFSVQIGQAVYGLSAEEIKQKRAALSQKSQAIFRNLYHEKAGHIPLKTHRLWLTSQETPFEADAQHLSNYIDSLKRSTAVPWEHHFWCLRKDQIPETIKRLQECGVTVHTHELAEILPHMKGRHIYQAYYDNNHFCLASNIVRQNIVYLNGGIYADLGTLFLEDLTPFTQAYDHIWWTNGKFLGQSFFGYQQNDPLMKNYLDKLDQLHRLPSKTRSLTPIFETQALWCGSPHLMAVIDKFSTSESRFLFVPEGDGSLMTISHAESWKRNKRFGNTPIRNGKINILEIDPKYSIERPFNPYIRKLLADPYGKSEGNFTYYRNFFTSVYEQMFSTTVDAVRVKRTRLLQRTQAVLDVLHEEHFKRLSPIPFSTHRIWLTSDETPFEVPEDRLRMYFESLQQLKAAKWSHHFWCLDADKIPKTIHALKQSGCNIQIHTLGEILPTMRGKDVFWRLYKGKYYTAASDILRFNIVNLKGGVYSDFGVEYNTDLTPYIERFDYIFGQEGFIAGTSFLAAPRNTPVFDNLLRFLDTLNRIPPAFRNFGEGIVTPPWTALGILTVMMDIYSRETDRILPCPYAADSLVKTNHMASWLGEGKFGQIPLGKKGLPPKIIFGEESLPSIVRDEPSPSAPYQIDLRRTIPNESLFSVPYHMNLEKDDLLKRYTLPIAKLLYGKEKAELDAKRAALYQRFKDTYHNLKTQPSSAPIPLISHRSWITGSESPAEVPLDRLQIYIKSLQILDTSPGWQHLFWCMDKTKIPETVKFLEATKGLNIQIREIKDILPSMRGRGIFEAFYKDNRFCNANDIFRLNVLYHQGGLYADMGCTFLKDLTPFLSLYDRLFFLYPWGNIDHGVCATKPHDDILDRYLNSLETLHLLPDEVKAITPTAPSQLAWTGSHHLMILLDLFSKETDKVMFIPRGQLLTVQHSHSWGVRPKFGNKSILESTVNIFRIL